MQNMTVSASSPEFRELSASEIDEIGGGWGDSGRDSRGMMRQAGIWGAAGAAAAYKTGATPSGIAWSGAIGAVAGAASHAASRS